MTYHRLLYRLGKVVPQMPAICHLHRIRRAGPNAFGVGTGPAHHLHTRMLKKPVRDGARGAVGCVRFGICSAKVCAVQSIVSQKKRRTLI